jgi:hypothetical protein
MASNDPADLRRVGSTRIRRRDEGRNGNDRNETIKAENRHLRASVRHTEATSVDPTEARNAPAWDPR